MLNDDDGDDGVVDGMDVLRKIRLVGSRVL